MVCCCQATLAAPNTSRRDIPGRSYAAIAASYDKRKYHFRNPICTCWLCIILVSKFSRQLFYLSREFRLFPFCKSVPNNIAHQCTGEHSDFGNSPPWLAAYRSHLLARSRAIAKDRTGVYRSHKYRIYSAAICTCCGRGETAIRKTFESTVHIRAGRPIAVSNLCPVLRFLLCENRKIPENTEVFGDWCGCGTRIRT